MPVQNALRSCHDSLAPAPHVHSADETILPGKSTVSRYDTVASHGRFLRDLRGGCESHRPGPRHHADETHPEMLPITAWWESPTLVPADQ